MELTDGQIKSGFKKLIDNNKEAILGACSSIGNGNMIFQSKHGELLPTEFHPAALGAFVYVREKLNDPLIEESFANRLGIICLETIRRLESDKPVSDRYLLGLAWALMRMEKEK